MLIQSLQEESENVDGDKWYWTNPTPQSVNFCRPLRMSFETEDDESIKKEFNHVRDEIDNLENHKFINSSGREITIKFVTETTMFDGKLLKI